MKAGEKAVPRTAIAADEPRADAQSGVSRRGFFKRAAVGTVALGGVAGAAKIVVSSIPDTSPQELYEKDIQAGDRAISGREYVLMSDREKRDMIHTFMDNYRNKA